MVDVFHRVAEGEASEPAQAIMNAAKTVTGAVSVLHPDLCGPAENKAAASGRRRSRTRTECGRDNKFGNDVAGVVVGDPKTGV